MKPSQSKPSNSERMEKAALRGEASYVWREGQARRWKMIQEAAGELLNGTILDNGCGVGLYLERMGATATLACGLEYEFDRALQARTVSRQVIRAAGEKLPYPNEHFDLVLSHEVIEHVSDDRAALREMSRVLKSPISGEGKPGGRLILFAPNRGYPFETHGVYLRGNYHFGNIPLVNYLPRAWRDRLAPHVRNYSTRDLDRLIIDVPLRTLHRTVIFGGYDNLIARWPRMGGILRKVLQRLESTWLRRFGLSHFWVLEKRVP